ncbi:alginate O-acetyltransferase complex protein AlgI [Pseudobutyrivibrio sp. UC1225]|uniref:MBOAT family O-acyltransferase n=1 Tax=Pseudobutyrivibrio sp. UC1225 TaxID=1798185 RepID=UPI0008DEFB45|nr:MBOAT family O-acyltransferase [Pseudobutyrivibrio sp. UC1225]SFO26506.1 alginate O-acetyltransferase complex protein AlgI [Pseudobutyrivibrio sp. UC1225]
MTFSSGIFLIGILPWFVVLYRKVCANNTLSRRILFAVANSIFLIWGGLASYLMLLFYAVVIWCFSLLITKIKQNWIFSISLILAVTPLLFIKYTRFVIESLNSFIGSNFTTSKIIVPMGISFVTFEAVSLLVDLKQNKLEKRPSLIDTYLYLTFFPTVTSGPIIRFNEFEQGLNCSSYSFDIAEAVERIAIGLSKKILIADKISVLADYYFDGVASGRNYSVAGLWIGSIAYTLQLYFDFSGYSDMAIGMGQLLGFDIRENFNKPYQAQSISDFWKRWHKSLTQWFRDYVYIPLGGNRCSKARHITNMLIVWLLTGLWHGADWSFILWGIGYFILLVVEKNSESLRKFACGVKGHIYTLFFVNLLWVPFRASNLTTTFNYIRGMFGGGSGMLENKAVRFLPLVIIAVILCFPWNQYLSRIAEKKWFVVLRGVTIILVVFLTICGAMNSSYTPYIYGNF